MLALLSKQGRLGTDLIEARECRVKPCAHTTTSTQTGVNWRSGARDDSWGAHQYVLEYKHGVANAD